MVIDCASGADLRCGMGGQAYNLSVLFECRLCACFYAVYAIVFNALQLESFRNQGT